MEFAAAAALGSAGYALNPTARPAQGPLVPHPSDVPSMNNVYDSTHWSQVRRDELARGSQRFAASMRPHETGVVPRPAYASMFQQPDEPSHIQTLAGETVAREDFTHQNMEPFFGGRVTQNVDPRASTHTLEMHTGVSALPYQSKQEVPSLFEPTGGLANVFGMQATDAYLQQRIEAPRARNNVFPIAPVRVGPGLGLGFTDGAAGGVQQPNTLDIIMPKCVDELRAATNPKLTYTTPAAAPPRHTAQRGLVGEMAKNKPETSYEQTQDQWLRTTGAVTGPTERPEVDMKPVARVEGHVPYQGGAAAANRGRGASDDYGKAAVSVYDNERSVTEARTVVANLTSVVKAVVAPLLDAFRPTPKEHTIEAPRTFGSVQAQMPSKVTMYDNVTHTMRTTIKETTVHDTTILNPRGTDATTAHLDDKARTTVRETVEEPETVRNVGGRVYRVQIYNTDEVARTTVKETTADAAGSMYGFVGGDVSKSEGAYAHIPVTAPLTEKQFLSDASHVGGAGARADFRPESEEAARNAEIDGTREALELASGNTPGAGGAYVGLSADGIDVASRKLDQDSMAARDQPNATRVSQQTVPAIDRCSITKPHELLNAQEGRLDPSVLNALKHNAFNLPVAPIGT